MSLDPLSGIQASTLLPARDSESLGEDPAVAFEQLLVETMLKEVRKSMPEELAGGRAGQMFGDLIDRQMAADIVAGGGLGMAQALREQLDQLPQDRGSWPIQLGSFRISSHFGHRHMGDHKGVDLAAAEGTPVRAVLPGEVSFAGDKQGYGQVVYVKHPDGSESRYAHLSAIDVQVGDAVGPGQGPVGRVGSTGRSTGPHLHLELRDAEGHAQDPLAALGLDPHDLH